MFYYQKYGLRPADRIVEPIFQTGLSKHHAIYLGMDHSGIEWIIENHKFTNVRLIRACDFFRPEKKYAIEKFQGNAVDREIAVKRGLDSVGRPYDLINFNCEHFAELVQNGVETSYQVQNVKELLTGIAAVSFVFILVNALFNEN